MGGWAVDSLSVLIELSPLSEPPSASRNTLFRLEVYRRLSPLRLLIAGGDGSIGWVLREIDSLHLKVISVLLSSFCLAV